MPPSNFGARFFCQTGTDPTLEVLRRNHWEVVIAGFIEPLRAVTIQMPKYELEQVEVYHYNERSKLLARPNVGNFKIEVYDTVNPNVVLNLDNWFRLGFNPDTAQIGYAANYKKTATIRLFDVNGLLIRSWFAYGLFLLNSPVPEEGYDYSSHEPVKIACNISCDWVTLTPGGVTPATTG